MELEIAPSLLATPVTGVNLMPGTLADQIGEGPTLLVFLRHFGCIFCREAVSDLRQISEARSDFPEVLFFFQGSATEGRAFLRRSWPGVRAVADPELELYEAFGVRRASWIEALGPGVLRASRKARKRGFENGPRDGDIWRMPGAFLVEGDRILWTHEPKHAADHPDFEKLADGVP